MRSPSLRTSRISSDAPSPPGLWRWRQLQSVELFLRRCVEMGGSDLHFKTDTGRAYVRVDGDLIGLDAAPFTDADFRTALYNVLKINQIAKFERDLELDFA